MKYHCIPLLNIYWLFKHYILGIYIFHVIGTWNKLSVCVCVCVRALTNECKDRQAISTQHGANRDDHFNQSVHLELSRTAIRHSTLTLASTKSFFFPSPTVFPNKCFANSISELASKKTQSRATGHLGLYN